jgi:hypothetical protein
VDNERLKCFICKQSLNADVLRVVMFNANSKLSRHSFEESLRRAWIEYWELVGDEDK